MVLLPNYNKKCNDNMMMIIINMIIITSATATVFSLFSFQLPQHFTKKKTPHTQTHPSKQCKCKNATGHRVVLMME